MKFETFTKSQTHRLLRRYVIAFLIVLSFVVTASTFAYWVGSVEASNVDAEGVLTIGYGLDAETEVSIRPNYLGNGSYLVPVNQIDNSTSEAVDSITLDYSLVWIESSNTSQVDGETIFGLIDSSVSYEIILEGETEALDIQTHQSIYNLVNIEASMMNTEKIQLNNLEVSKLQFTISLDEPDSQTDYVFIQSSTINIYFTFSINTEIYDLNLDFTNMTMTELMTYNIDSSSITQWNFTEDGLENNMANTRIFFPITVDEYTLTVNVSLSEGTSGGYGILFDTVLNDGNASSDTGYIFQFDRGYASGEMIVRPRVYGSERNPSWSHKSTDNYLFPNKNEDSSWWTATHEIKIQVINIDSETREASFYIDDAYLGSFTYEDTITDEQVYVGFRGWGSSYSTYYDLKVE
ncbi:MAG: hypothetical protein JEZ05_09270 [Tenericutes bacterium]|nr:hypothetical protein [Mycoplasmatota bacterium]